MDGKKVLGELSKYWPILLIFLFAVTIFARPTLFDMDSYYFMGISCGHEAFRPDTDSYLTGFLFEHLPCDMNVFKGILVAIFTLCVIIAEKTGQLVNKEHAHWLIFIYGGALSFYSYFAKLEDDTLGLPFVFGSIFFLTKWAIGKDLKDFVIAVGICAVGFLVWKGIAIWALIVIATGPLSWVVSGFLLWEYSSTLFARFTIGASEELPIAGVLSSGLVLLGGLFLPTYFLPTVSLAFMLAVIKLKYSLYLGLLCSLGMYFYLSKRDFFESDSKKVFGFEKKQAFIVLLIVLNLSSIIGIFSGPPNQETTQLIESFSNTVKDHNLTHAYNDWEYGHLVKFYDVIPSNQFGPPTPSFEDVNGFVLTHQLLHCKVLEEYGTLRSYEC